MLIANSCLDIRNRWWNEACVLSGSGVRGQRLNCDLRGGYERPVGVWYPRTARRSFTKTSNKCVFPRRARNVLSHVRPNLHFWKAKSVKVIWDRRLQLIPPTGGLCGWYDTREAQCTVWLSVSSVFWRPTVLGRHVACLPIRPSSRHTSSADHTVLNAHQPGEKKRNCTQLDLYTVALSKYTPNKLQINYFKEIPKNEWMN